MDLPADAWARRLALPELPVLRATAQEVERWARRPDDVDAHLLAEIAARDPLMCVRVLAEPARRFGERLVTPAETVTAALLMTGIEPFFATCAQLPVLEDRLAAQPHALAVVRALVARSSAAARIAAAFAIHRQDDDVEKVQLVALLHDFAALLLWYEAPGEADAIRRRLAEDPTLRTAHAQRDVLGVELDVVADALLAHWQLPDYIRALAYRPRQADARSRSVALAVRIARHLESGWSNAALPDDLAEAGALLNLKAVGVTQLVRDALA